MKNFFILLFVFCIINPLHAQLYYVDVGGANSLSTDINSPGDITYTFANAPKHAIVYIKAGVYGTVNLTVGFDSTTFIGYNQTPGDLGVSDMPNSLNTYLSNNYETIYPTINKNNRAASGGSGITINKKGVELSNFYIKNYPIGVSVANSNVLLESIILDGIGDPNTNYHGWGIHCYGHYNTIRNCFILNAAQEAYTIKGNYNSILSSKAYANDNTGYTPTDYYFVMTLNSATKKGKYNLIKDCYAERVGNLSHVGHGFCCISGYFHKACDSGGGYCYDPSYRNDSVSFNKIENCVTKNIAETVLLRGPNTSYNNFENLSSVTFGGLYPIWGAKHNTFTNCVINNSDYGIRYQSSTYGDTTDTNVSYNAQSAYPWNLTVASEGNRFINCLFNNVTTGISHDSYFELVHPVSGNYLDRINRKIIKNNDYVNCTFIGKTDTTINTQLFHSMRASEGNRMINCLIYNFDNFEARHFPTSTSPTVLGNHGLVPTNYLYDHCNFFSNGFNAQVINNGTLTPVANGYTPGYNNTLAGTFNDCNVLYPGFINAIEEDYHIQSIPSSGTIDKGRSLSEMVNIGYGFVNFDLDNNSRPCAEIYDIGAYENSCLTSINSNINNNTILVYPIPTKNEINIKSKQVINFINLFTLDGKKVSQTNVNAKTLIMNVSYLTPGLYIMEINRNNEILMHKLIIK